MVKNLIVNNPDVHVKILTEKLEERGIQYRVNVTELYTEVITEEETYKLYSFAKLSCNRNIVLDDATMKKFSDFSTPEKSSGYKKYTKSKIKSDNKRFKSNTKGK